MSNNPAPKLDAGIIQTALAVAVSGYVIAQFADSPEMRQGALIVFLLGSCSAFLFLDVHLGNIKSTLRNSSISAILAYGSLFMALLLGMLFSLASVAVTSVGEIVRAVVVMVLVGAAYVYVYTRWL